MINLFPNEKFTQRITNIKSQRGAAILIFSTLMLVSVTMVVLFAASYSLLSQKMNANQYRSSQAFSAAQAGLEFGIQYLANNTSAITANPVNGYIPSYTSSSTTNVTLANNSKYSIVYTNPVQNNYNLIQVTSTGTNDDGTATKTVSQQVEYGSMLHTVPQQPMTSKSNVEMTGNSTITNMQSGTTIVAGSTVTLSGSSKTITQSGGSTSSSMSSDIQQNVSPLSSESQADFFATYFGVTTTTLQNSVAHSYTNSSSTNYSSILNGMTGTSVWINQTSGTASIQGNVTIGSAANPVLVVVNGTLAISGNVKIYGLIFVIGTGSADTDITGNVAITGALISTTDMILKGNTSHIYDSSVLSAIQNQAAISYFAKVPGSWKDY